MQRGECFNALCLESPVVGYCHYSYKLGRQAPVYQPDCSFVSHFDAIANPNKGK